MRTGGACSSRRREVGGRILDGKNGRNRGTRRVESESLQCRVDPFLKVTFLERRPNPAGCGQHEHGSVGVDVIDADHIGQLGQG